MSTAEGERLRDAILQNRRAHGMWFTNLDHYARSTNLLDKVDALVAADRGTAQPARSRQLNDFVRAEAMATRVVRDAVFDTQLALGPFSMLQPAQPNSTYALPSVKCIRSLVLLREGRKAQ